MNSIRRQYPRFISPSTPIVNQTTSRRIHRVCFRSLTKKCDSGFDRGSFAAKKQPAKTYRRVFSTDAQSDDKRDIHRAAENLKIALFRPVGEAEADGFREFAASIDESNYQEAFDTLFSRKCATYLNTSYFEFMLPELARLHGDLEYSDKYDNFVLCLKKYLDENYARKSDTLFFKFAKKAYAEARHVKSDKDQHLNYQKIKTFVLAMDAVFEGSSESFQVYIDLMINYFVEGYSKAISISREYENGDAKGRSVIYSPDQYWNKKACFRDDESYKSDILISFNSRYYLESLFQSPCIGNIILKSILTGFVEKISMIEDRIIANTSDRKLLETFSDFCHDLLYMKDRVDSLTVHTVLTIEEFAKKIMVFKPDSYIFYENKYNCDYLNLILSLPDCPRPPKPEKGSKDAAFLEFIYSHPKITMRRKWEFFRTGADRLIQMGNEGIVRLIEDMASDPTPDWGVIIPYIPFSRFEDDTIKLAYILKKMDDAYPTHNKQLRDFLNSCQSAE